MPERSHVSLKQKNQSAQKSKEIPPVPIGLNAWVDMLSDDKFPVFGPSVRAVLSAIKAEKPAAAVSEVILTDPTLTTKVLKMVNSAAFNVNGTPIDTISRAVVIMGINNIRTLCITVGLMDSLLKGKKLHVLLEEIEFAFHSALQAKGIVQFMTNEDMIEPIYIATLLQNLGLLMVLCFGQETGEELARAYQTSDKSPEDIEKEILGFPIKELSLRLAKEWDLGKTLEASLKTKISRSTFYYSITLARDLAENLKKGWYHHDSFVTLQEMQTITELPFDEVVELVGQTLEATKEVLTLYNIPNELPQKIEEEYEKSLVEDVEPVLERVISLGVIKKLQDMIRTDPPSALPDLLSSFVDGIREGIDFDRVLISFLVDNRKKLQGKCQSLCQLEKKFEFEFNLEEDEGKLFSHLIQKKIPCWAGKKNDIEFKGYILTPLTRKLETKEFFAVPLMIKNTPIGLVYADRHPTYRTLEKASFDAFCQAVTGLGQCIEKLKSA